MTPAVEITGLRKSYLSSSGFFRRRRNIEALSGIDISVHPGEIFGLVGRNGYGKTTLIKCVAGLLAPSEGKIRVHGKDTQQDDKGVRHLIGWVGAEERSFYLRLTARQNLMFFARLQGLSDSVARERIAHFCERLSCTELLEARVHELSTGNRQRVSIVRGIMHDPKLLILDEPTRSLDPFAATNLRHTLMDWVKEDTSRSILVTSHHLHEVESMSDRIAVMGKGRIGAVGTLRELRDEFGRGQTVQIEVARAPNSDELSALSARGVPADLTTDGQKHVLSFRHPFGSDVLETVLQATLNAGWGILRITSTEIQLQDLIDLLEHERP